MQRFWDRDMSLKGRSTLKLQFTERPPSVGHAQLFIISCKLQSSAPWAVVCQKDPASQVVGPYVSQTE